MDIPWVTFLPVLIKMSTPLSPLNDLSLSAHKCLIANDCASHFLDPPIDHRISGRRAHHFFALDLCSTSDLELNVRTPVSILWAVPPSTVIFIYISHASSPLVLGDSFSASSLPCRDIPIHRALPRYSLLSAALMCSPGPRSACFQPPLHRRGNTTPFTTTHPVLAGPSRHALQPF